MNKIPEKIISALGIVCFLFAWEFVAVNKIISPIYIGTPHNIALNIFRIFVKPEWRLALLTSLIAFLISYSLAIIAGIVLGLFLGVNKKLYQFLSPFIYIFNTIPYIAILPVFIIWLGIGFKSKLLMAFLMIVSPILIYTIESTKTIDQNLIKMAKSFGAKEHFILKYLYFFHSLPYIFSGGRAGIGRGVSAIVVAEIYGLGIGIGYYVSFFGTTYQTDKLMALVFIIVSFNLLMLSLLKRLQKRVIVC